MLKNYRVGLPKDSPEVRLLAPPGTKDAYFSRFGWLGEGIELPNDKTVWQASGPRLTPETPVTLSWRNGTGQIFQLALSIDDNYLITVDQKVANQGGGPVAVRPYGLISRRGGCATTRNPYIARRPPRFSWASTCPVRFDRRPRPRTRRPAPAVQARGSRRAMSRPGTGPRNRGSARGTGCWAGSRTTAALRANDASCWISGRASRLMTMMMSSSRRASDGGFLASGTTGLPSRIPRA